MFHTATSRSSRFPFDRQKTCLDARGRRWLVALSFAASLTPLPLPNSHGQGPLPPEQARQALVLADPGLTIELAAAEPNVISPVAIAWDARGDLFVAEMIDYPQGPGQGQIRRLRDADQDGYYEEALVFARELPFPNSVLPWNGGILVTAAPDLWFLKDSDGDGVVEERRQLLTGFGAGNQQLRANGLSWGIDNWIYGANGRSDGEVRSLRAAQAPVVSIRRRDFRFRPATGEFEAITGFSQFGLARDDWGNRFLSWNTIPLRHVLLEERYLNRNALLGILPSAHPLIPESDSGEVFPLTPPPLVFNAESSSHFNALAGLTLYRGDALGAAYRGNAFMGESLRNLVHRRVLEPEGVTFAARRAETNQEFLASTDPWFHPVNFPTGPDGALYVVDFYRQFVEHPDYVPAGLRDKVDWRTGHQHGRIWRVRSKDKPVSHAPPGLDHATIAQWVEHLGHPNAWWRETAQRLLVERNDSRAVPLLLSILQNTTNGHAQARLHALWTFDGLNKLQLAVIRAALTDRHPAVREHAVLLSEKWLKEETVRNQAADAARESASAPPPEEALGLLRRDLFKLVSDPSVRVRFQLALTLGETSGEDRIEPILHLIETGVEDPWQRSALLCSLGGQAGTILLRLERRRPDWFRAPSESLAHFLQAAGQQAGGGNLDQPTGGFPRAFANLPHDGAILMMAGAAEGLKKAGVDWRARLAEWEQTETASDGAKASAGERVSGRVSGGKARVIASSAQSQDRLLAVRLAATRLAGGLPAAQAKPILLSLLHPAEPAALQAAAADVLADFVQEVAWADLAERWRSLPLGIRRQMIASFIRSSPGLGLLAEGVLVGDLHESDLDGPARQALLASPEANQNSRLEPLLKKWAAPGRAELIEQYQSALRLAGDAKKGAAHFSQACVVCHTIGGFGGSVGPDLSGAASRPKEALLVDIMDPNRQLTPDYLSYRVRRSNAEETRGLLARETAASIVLRRANEPDLLIPRSDIQHLQAEAVSLMPEGLEQGLSPQDMADLLEFLHRPKAEWLRQ